MAWISELKILFSDDGLTALTGFWSLKMVNSLNLARSQTLRRQTVYLHLCGLAILVLGLLFLVLRLQRYPVLRRDMTSQSSTLNLLAVRSERAQCLSQTRHVL